MAIINILVGTIIGFLCGIMQLVAGLLGGVSALLGKLSEYLYVLTGKLMKLVYKPKNADCTKFNVPVG